MLAEKRWIEFGQEGKEVCGMLEMCWWNLRSVGDERKDE
jgi:hypothetical protein